MDTQQEQQIVRECIYIYIFFYKKVYTKNTLYDVIQHDRDAHILNHTRFHGFFVFLLEIVQQFQSLSVNHTLQSRHTRGQGGTIYILSYNIALIGPLHLTASAVMMLLSL